MYKVFNMGIGFCVIASPEEADAVVIGAGAGLSTSAGFVYNGERFEKHFSDEITY